MRRKAECIIARDYSNPSWFCRLLHRSLSGIAAREGRRDDKTIKAEKEQAQKRERASRALQSGSLGGSVKAARRRWPWPQYLSPSPLLLHKIHRTWFRPAGRGGMNLPVP